MAVSLLQLAQSRAECMIARTMQQAAGDRDRSGDGTTPLAAGWPKEWPIWVLSVLHSVGDEGE